MAVAPPVAWPVEPVGWAQPAKRSGHAYLPGELEARVAAFVEHYNHARAHESLGNLTPADVNFRSDETILCERARIKRQTLMDRRLRHQAQAAYLSTQVDQNLRS